MNPRRWAGIALWAAALILLWLALRGVDWRSVATVIGRLKASQIAVLAGINLGIVFLIGFRWWLILRAQGFRVPILAAVAYRLAAFSVSYFTPGPHFGGEPLQVYLAVRREGIPAGSAAASVALDKLLELAFNFAFLVFGISVLISGGLLQNGSAPLPLAAALFLAALPMSYLLALGRGRRPAAGLFDRTRAADSSTWRRLAGAAARAEREAGRVIRQSGFKFFLAVLLSALIWVALVYEFALVAGFLGMALRLDQVVAALTAARIAILLPMPGGLGTLEAALVLVTQALGEGAAIGAGLSLLIRARDVLFGAAGLYLGRVLSLGQAVSIAQESDDHPT